MERCKSLLPPVPAEKHHLPYLGPGLDAGLATLMAEEIFEAVRYLTDPNFYVGGEEVYNKGDTKIWVGAADDVIMRKRGIEFVDGSAPGFAAIVGAAPTVQEAIDLVTEYQKKNLYIFCAAKSIDGKTSVPEQLLEGGVQIGWPTRIVPYSPEISGAVFALGFAVAGRHGLRRRQTRRRPEEPALQQGPDLCLCQSGIRNLRRVVRQRRRRHQLGLSHHHQPGHPPGAAHRYLHLRARGEQRAHVGVGPEVHRSPGPQGLDYRDRHSGELRRCLRGRAGPQGRPLSGVRRRQDPGGGAGHQQTHG